MLIILLFPLYLTKEYDWLLSKDSNDQITLSNSHLPSDYNEVDENIINLYSRVLLISKVYQHYDSETNRLVRDFLKILEKWTNKIFTLYHYNPIMATKHVEYHLFKFIPSIYHLNLFVNFISDGENFENIYKNFKYIYREYILINGENRERGFSMGYQDNTQQSSIIIAREISSRPGDFFKSVNLSQIEDIANLVDSEYPSYIESDLTKVSEDFDPMNPIQKTRFSFDPSKTWTTWPLYFRAYQLQVVLPLLEKYYWQKGAFATNFIGKSISRTLSERYLPILKGLVHHEEQIDYQEIINSFWTIVNLFPSGKIYCEWKYHFLRQNDQNGKINDIYIKIFEFIEIKIFRQILLFESHTNPTDLFGKAIHSNYTDMSHFWSIITAFSNMYLKNGNTVYMRVDGDSFVYCPLENPVEDSTSYSIPLTGKALKREKTRFKKVLDFYGK